MNQHVATLVFAFGILMLFALCRDRKARTSKALWIPTIWLLIAGSRMVSQWLQMTPQISTPQQYIDGSPLDRLILTALMMAGVVVLIGRWRRVSKVLRMNAPILLFFAYCAVSVLWSDYPGVALRRWVKAVGDVVMIMIILTDRHRSDAIRKVIARVGFVLIPLSVLLIKYYPGLGRRYEHDIGQMSYIGVTTNKNMLGMVCMLFGIGCLWLLVKALRKDRHKLRHLVALGSVLVMVLWLLHMASSATSWACFLLGSALILLLNMPGRIHPSRVHLVIGSMVFTALLAVFVPGIYASAVHALGRNTGLTGRIHLWHVLLGTNTSPWLGAGYSSFWLGDRLQKLWTIFVWHVNEAHNGYLEIYLNLGMIGVGLLFLLLLTGYRNGISAFRRDPDTGSLRVAYIAVAAVYNMAEAAFKMLSPIWLLFLLAIIAVPETPVTIAEVVYVPEEADLPSDDLAAVGLSAYNGAP